MLDYYDDDNEDERRWCSCCGPDYRCVVCEGGIMSHDEFTYNDDGMVCENCKVDSV